MYNLTQVSYLGVYKMNANEEIDEIERRLSEGNITEDEMYPQWNKVIKSAFENNSINPDKILNLCHKLRSTDFICESGINELDEEQKIYIKKKYSDYIFKFVKNDNLDDQIRLKAWNMYKNIITSVDRIPEEGCRNVFKYFEDNSLGNGQNEKNNFLKQEFEDMAYYLLSKYPLWKSEGLFVLNMALINKQIDAHKCIAYLRENALTHPMSNDEIKVGYSICDEIIEQNPELREFSITVFKNLYHNTGNNSASRRRAENILYRIANKYSKFKNFIEQDIVKRPLLQPQYDTLPSLEWIHIGTEKPTDEKFQNVYNKNGDIPIRGGLYTAPKGENGLSEWHNWLITQDWTDRIDKIYYVNPAKDTKCLVIKSQEDANPYLVARGKRQILDAKALAKDYDCVYISNPRSLSMGELRDYDVSSLIFLKPNTFTAYTEEEYAQHKALQQKMEKVRQMSNPQEISEQRASISNAHNSKNNTNYNNGFGGGR